MASILAEGVVGKVCEMAVQQAANEVSIVWNFKKDFEWLMHRVKQVNYFLNEADRKSGRQKDFVKEWLQSVRDIAWEAENILQMGAADSMYETNTQLCTLSCNQLITRYRMGRRIQKVKARFRSQIEDGIQLIIADAALSHGEEAESSQRRRFKRLSLLPGDSKPVGINPKIDSLVNFLENPQFPVIAVVGMGGMGKTYLLQHVYDAQKGRYEKSAWLSVSQFYSLSKLLSNLAFQLNQDLSMRIKGSGISEELAAEEIHRFIQGKRCLVVLDDVWRASREGDLLTRLGIPSGANSQCKVLISTRSREVCINLHAKIYEMESLTDEESWKLFCAHAFPETDGNRAPEYLAEVAHNITKECANLPLAIKTTAASLASKTMPKDWESKLSMLKKVDSPDDPVMDILRLSYDSLPAHLKACFAYLSIFPEDEEIDCEYLVYLWRAEGFIPEGKDPWDCFYQLANLCLIEVLESDFYIDPGKYCKIHDLLLDLAILISRENKCAFSVEDAFGAGHWRRLFLAKKDIEEHAISERRLVFPALVCTLSLSSNKCIGGADYFEGSIPTTLFSGMRVLRVLDLSFTNISTLPACVGKMKLLKVLRLRATKIREVPECVRYLKSLSYLDVAYCDRFSSGAPKWISEVKCLEYLRGRFETVPKGLSMLQSLRTLRTPGCLSLSVGEDDMLSIEDVGKMTELKEISFTVSDGSQLRKMEEGVLAPLLNMSKLNVKNNIKGMQGETEADLPQFPERMSALKDLEHLRLNAFAVPTWVWCLSNLTYLCLVDCHCSNYPDLQAMPNLVNLILGGNKRCKEFPKVFGKSGGFPRLLFFDIDTFPELQEFPEMEDGAMARLEKLTLYRCEKVSRVGEGLERLKRLREISIESSGSTVLREMFREGGIYYEKFKAINSQITIVVV